MILVRLLGLGLLAVGLFTGAGATPPAARAGGRVVSQDVQDRVTREGRVRVIVELRLSAGALVPEGQLSSDAAVWAQRSDIGAARSQVLSRLQGRGHRVLRQYQTIPLLALEVQSDALGELEASGFYVQRVVEDTLNAPTLSQSVPLIQGDQAWATGYDGTGLMVAILDTGVDKTHPFLAGKVVAEACYSSNVSGRSTSLCPNGQAEQIGPGAGGNCSVSGCWHGTHVAGIVAGNGDAAGVSFSGVAKGAQIMAVQVFSRFSGTVDCGGLPPCVLAWTSDIIAGLERVYSLSSQHPFSSVNVSLGGGISSAPCDNDPSKPSIDNLRSVGIATVVAAGNNGSRTSLSSPACISSAVSVGSTTKADVVSSFSNVAPFLSLFAPGGSITSSYPDASWAIASGTSMATPHVTGAWAVLKQAAPGASVSAILTALQQTGLPITDTRSGGTVTKPRIRVAQALSALGSPPPPPPPPTPTVTASPGSVPAGASVTVTVSNGPGNTNDWVGLFAVGTADTAYLGSWYLNGAQTPPSSGLTSASFSVLMPTQAGSYEFRLFSDGTRLATSGPVTVTSSPPPPNSAVTVSATSVLPRANVTATVSNGPGNTRDWVGMFKVGTPDSVVLERKYLNGSKTKPPRTGLKSASLKFRMPSESGPYEFRLFAGGSNALLATSPTITVR